MKFNYFNMKLCVIFVFGMFALVSCDISNVYEFCSALMSDRHTPCDQTTCHGSPGKKGSQGLRGIKGDRGNTGPEGTCDTLENQIDQLESEINRMRRTMLPEQKIAYCALGMKSRVIPDSAISTSSDWETHHHGQYARLDELPASNPTSYGAWIPHSPSVNDWIQIDLGSLTSVAGLVTQGRPVSSGDQWVTSYIVKCGNTIQGLTTISQAGVDKIFTANTDKDTKVTNIFPTPVTCRYVRVYARTWHNHLCMRFEILRGDCFDIYRI